MSEARTPARIPQVKLARGAEGEELISSKRTEDCRLSSWNNLSSLTEVSLRTLWQRRFGLAVKHEVDPRERDVSEESGHQAGEQSCRTFSLTHAAQSPTHAHVTVPATLEQDVWVR